MGRPGRGKRLECPWTGKIILFTVEDAEKKARHLNKHQNMGIFKCRQCTYWHLFTKNKKREKPDESIPD